VLLGFEEGAAKDCDMQQGGNNDANDEIPTHGEI
jgi:hypothetical protein